MSLFGFKPKSDEVLNHWIGFADHFSYSSKEFYALIEQELTARKIPGLEIIHTEYSEGGLLADRRLYLRMIRERLAFETCAAPFGTSFFFSCWGVYSPAALKLWHILLMLTFLGI